MKMVEIAFIIGSFVVPLGVSLLVCLIVLGRVYKTTIEPLVILTNEGQEKLDAAVKTAMSAMGTKSGQVRQTNQLEKDIAGDLMDQLPEVEMILELLSPDTANSIRENPEKALRLLERYKDFIPLFTGAAGPKKQEIVYDL